jgi:hypothetical protein
MSNTEVICHKQNQSALCIVKANLIFRDGTQNYTIK